MRWHKINTTLTFQHLGLADMYTVHTQIKINLWQHTDTEYIKYWSYSCRNTTQPWQHETFRDIQTEQNPKRHSPEHSVSPPATNIPHFLNKSNQIYQDCQQMELCYINQNYVILCSYEIFPYPRGHNSR